MKIGSSSQKKDKMTLIFCDLTMKITVQMGEKNPQGLSVHLKCHQPPPKKRKYGINISTFWLINLKHRKHIF